MKSLWIFGAVVLTVAGVWIALPAEPACAMGGCSPGGVTLPAWGMGHSCQASEDNAINLAISMIPSDCDVCGITPVEVTPCHLCGTDPNDPPDCTGANDYRADWKVRYRCESDFGIPPM